MESEQPGGSRPEQIDFPALWFLARGVQVLLVVFFAKAMYLHRGTDLFSLDLFDFIGMTLLIGLFFRGIATGTADSCGIQYRLFSRLKTVAWVDVQEIQWIGFRLKVAIKRGSKRKRVLVFLLNPLKSLGPYWAHRLGTEVLPPQILEHIRALPIDTPPKMASAPPYSKWLLRIFIGFAALFVLVFLWRLLSAGQGASH